MDTTALRTAYEGLLEAAALPDLGEARDGGWDADQVLAHLISVDAAVAAVAMGVVSGSRPAFDNRVCLDPWNLHRIVTAHGGRAELARRVRTQAGLLCDLADELDGDVTSVLVPCLLVSNDALVVDEPMRLGDLIDGLAANHVPVHTRQLLDLRGNVPAAL